MKNIQNRFSRSLTLIFPEESFLTTHEFRVNRKKKANIFLSLLLELKNSPGGNGNIRLPSTTARMGRALLADKERETNPESNNMNRKQKKSIPFPMGRKSVSFLSRRIRREQTKSFLFLLFLQTKRKEFFSLFTYWHSRPRQVYGPAAQGWPGQTIDIPEGQRVQSARARVLQRDEWVCLFTLLQFFCREPEASKPE